MKREQRLFSVYNPKTRKYLVSSRGNVWQEDVSLAWVTNKEAKAGNKIRIDLGLDYLEIVEVVPALPVQKEAPE